MGIYRVVVIARQGELSLETVSLASLDVAALFHELRNTTGLFREWKESGDDIVAQCPFHGGGNERKPSFGICISRANPHYGKFNCFACGASGTIISLINRLHNREDNDNFAVGFAQNVCDVYMEETRKHMKMKSRTEVIEESRVSIYELNYYRHSECSYLTEERHLDVQVQNAFDCGFDPITNSVTFPVRKMDGSTQFLVRRSIVQKWYNYPAGVDKPVYGIYEFSKLAPESKSVVVVESIINALTLWGAGIPAVALLGTGSGSQIESMNKMNIRHWVLALDGDQAGVNGINKLQKALKSSTSVMPMPYGYDVNNLDLATLLTLYQLRR